MTRPGMGCATTEAEWEARKYEIRMEAEASRWRVKNDDPVYAAAFVAAVSCLEGFPPIGADE